MFLWSRIEVIASVGGKIEDIVLVISDHKSERTSAGNTGGDEIQQVRFSIGYTKGNFSISVIEANDSALINLFEQGYGVCRNFITIITQGAVDILPGCYGSVSCKGDSAHVGRSKGTSLAGSVLLFKTARMMPFSST